MHKCKIDNFLREYPQQQFPQFRSLSYQECIVIKSRLMKNFSYNNNIDDLLKSFCHSENRCGNYEEDGISLIHNLLNINVKETTIFINWGKFDDIDEIAASDFLRYFDDIWYPVADDIDIFDKSCQWVMCISHWSDIFMSKSKKYN